MDKWSVDGFKLQPQFLGGFSPLVDFFLRRTGIGEEKPGKTGVFDQFQLCFNGDVAADDR